MNTEKEITHFHIADNSDGLREWLKIKGIDFIENGHFTSISIKNDIFRLGMEFALHRDQHGYAIFEPNGVMRYPVFFQKRDAIKYFISDAMLTWEECKEIGWTCKKVTISLKTK